MKKKLYPKLRKGQKLRNRVSGKIVKVRRVSPVPGWFMPDSHRLWTCVSYFTKVRAKVKKKLKKRKKGRFFNDCS